MCGKPFLLIEGESFILYSFKDPKPDIPSGIVASVLDRHAFTKAKKPEEGRFGLSSPPEQLGIRGSAALLFDNDGELTLFWQDQRASHVATSTVEPADTIPPGRRSPITDVKLAITGATGFIGKQLIKELQSAKAEYAVITRNRAAARKSCPDANSIVKWNPPETGPDPAMLEGLDGVVHLAGRSGCPTMDGRYKT